MELLDLVLAPGQLYEVIVKHDENVVLAWIGNYEFCKKLLENPGNKLLYWRIKDFQEV